MDKTKTGGGSSTKNKKELVKDLETTTKATATQKVIIHRELK